MAKRKRTARLRQLTDLEIRHLQVHGSARFSAFVRGQFTSGTRPATALSDSGRRWMQSLRRGVLKQNLAVALAAVVIIGFGSRYLVTGGLPVVIGTTSLHPRSANVQRRFPAGIPNVGPGNMSHSNTPQRPVSLLAGDFGM